MSYAVPLQEIRFVLEELAGLDEILALPALRELGPDLFTAIIEESARFVEGEVAPLNRAGDVHPPVYRDGAVTTTPGFAAAFRDYGAGGWQGLQHPPQWGGQGLPKLLAAVTNENINGASLAFALCPLLTDAVIEALLAAGSEALRARFVPPLVSGAWTGTMNLTEPQAGSDLAQVATRAVPQADGSYRLTGQKIYITWGEHDVAENIIHLVLARTPGAPAGVKGISLFVVPKFIPGADGRPGLRNDVWCAGLEHKLGIHGSPTAVMVYGGGQGEAGEGAVGYLVGEENRGLEYMFITMNAARFAVGQQGVALCERVCQQAVAYARDRVQGRAVEGSTGPVPIVRHPDVQRMLLTMQALTQATRAISYVAAGARDRAQHLDDAAARTRQRGVYEFLVPVVKGFCTETAVEVASLGLQVHGGMGYIEETGAAQHYRDARILPIYEGTTAIQANDLIGRKVLRDGGQTAYAMLEEMADTVAALDAAAARASAPEAPAWALLSANLRQAMQAQRESLDFILSTAPTDPRAAYAGSVPFLMLTGVLHGGWQMARAALACAAPGRADSPFHSAKRATAFFYGAVILPRALGYAASIRAGEVVRHCADAAGLA